MLFMKKRFAAFATIAKRTFKEWNASDPFRQSAVIAYYAIFSLPALLVLIINFVGLFYEKEAISGEIYRQIEGVMGEDTATQVANIVDKASEIKAGVISSIIAVITIITGATGVFVELQKSLDHIWEVKQRDDLNFFQKLRTQLFSFGLILAIGFLLMVSLVVSTALAAFSNWIEGVFPDAVAYLFYALEVVVSLGVITVLFALMFKFLPDIKIKLRSVWPGAILTAALFMVGKYGLSIYFGKAEPGSVYGAAGSIILVLLWVSYSSMIVFFGAEFTHQFVMYHQMRVKPASIAEKTKDAHGLDWERKQHSGTAITEKDEHMNHHAAGEKMHVHTYVHHNGKDHEQHEKEKIAEEKNPDHHEKQEKEHKAIQKKFKSLKDLRNEIDQKERRLEDDKEDIVDRLMPSHILASLVPKAWRATQHVKEKLSMDDYLRHIARRHITRKKEEGLMDRILRMMHLEHNGDGNHSKK
jgi:membrane protein